MTKRTKKVGTTGKFGVRYGMRIRRRYRELDEKMRAPHKCPTCEREAVKRVASGIWECRKCGAKFSGGAYLPKTSVAKTADKIMKKVVGE